MFKYILTLIKNVFQKFQHCRNSGIDQSLNNGKAQTSFMKHFTNVVSKRDNQDQIQNII